jgi:hypothetical protein
MSIKEILLKKGWAGKTISRPETAQRLNPLIHTMSNILRAHNHVAASTDSSGSNSPLSEQVRLLRMDIGKMSETVFSSGGVATRTAEPYVAGLNGNKDLLDAENALLSDLRNEKDIEHQMRTRAILAAVAANTENRIQLLRQLV